MKRVVRCLLLVVVVLMTTLSLPTASRADDAEEQFTKGQRLYEDGKYDKALPLFRAALAATSSPNARLYVARCLAKLNKNAEAYEEMKQTVADATERAESEPRYAETRDSAAALLALLENKVAKLVVAISDQHRGARVEINGVVIKDPGVPHAVEPGEVLVRGKAPKKKLVEKRFELPAGVTRTITLAFEDAAAGEVATPAPGDEPTEPAEPAEPDDPSPGDIGALRAAGIVVTVLGVGGFVAFAITGALARGKFNQLEEECGGTRCTAATYADVIDQGKRLETTANVMAGIGSGLVVAGVLMIVFGGPSDEELISLRPTIELGPHAESAGAGATFRARW
jgi:hypothetical protein